MQKNNGINASVSGYFSSHTDGYEQAFDVSKLKELTPGALGEDKIQKKDVSQNVIGKIIDKVYWYIIFEVSSEDTLKIKNAAYLKVNIPVVSNDNILLETECINQPDKSGNSLVVMKGTYMNEQMSNIRNEDVSIMLDDFTGIYVPKTAVHEKVLKYTSTDDEVNEKKKKKSTSGVYVRIGNEISFRQIEPIYSGDDYVISNVSIKEENTADDTEVLRIYDQIVTEGANLYDGKIIQRSS